ncbi:hypothetical protein Acor_47040 [Acrocarpospora corrugata]|uniref:Uncharacterized protein n=1 Tax=Acrocarpospora corrugata TaxID=35763 RepID=A0A5M3W7Z9_9ACTN|nr:hypothetical protein [Acrocarpospora corrugata]GES02638.1 hypothetical protein Acor_47040 [Acrocarpospora corrugata]
MARRSWGDIAFGGFLVLTVAGVTALLIRPPSASGPARPLITPAFPAQLAAFPSVREVWPDAVVKVPAWSFRDWALRPLARMDPTRVLMEEVGDPGEDSGLVAFNLQMGLGVPLGAIPNRRGREEHEITAATAADGAVAWYRTVEEKSRTVGEIWSMLEKDGKAVLLTTVLDVTVGRDPKLVIDGENLFWSFPHGGVDRVPLKGGTVERVRYTEGMRMKDWPWIGDDRRLLNLVTGERITVRAPADADVNCGFRWCVGTQIVSTTTVRVFIQRPDGSRRTMLPPWVVFPFGLLGQRYLLLQTVPPHGSPAGDKAPSSIVYDLDTGLTATLMTLYGTEPVLGAGGVNPGVADPLVYWATSDKATTAPKSESKRNLVRSAADFALTHQGVDALFAVPEKYWLLDTSSITG